MMLTAALLRCTFYSAVFLVTRLDLSRRTRQVSPFYHPFGFCPLRRVIATLDTVTGENHDDVLLP